MALDVAIVWVTSRKITKTVLDFIVDNNYTLCSKKRKPPNFEL